MKTVVCWSGGLDSTVLIAHQRKIGYEIYPIFINRGQSNYKYEKQSVEYFTKKWELPTLEVCLTFPPKEIKINRAIVKKIGHPMRNSTLVNVAVYYAVMNDIKRVVVGSNHSDWVPDCSLEFWNEKQDEVRQAINDESFWVLAPFQDMKWTKKDIMIFAIKNGIPHEKTRTCWLNTKDACGKCRTCMERKKATELASSEL